ncbi:MAG TPA: metallophosphoesterase, partial [Paludibacteraceae bacterium]|nr:metallophosphoesterase [Paludibacteraceae bacterium]
LKYTDPIKAANRYAEILKNKEKCDFVIVLSHLGYSSDPEIMSDSLVAVNSRNIDLILGGHTHEIRGVFDIKNLDNKSVSVLQAHKSAKEITTVVVEY